jgi:predicted MFS family arabinose efflux permease
MRGLTGATPLNSSNPLFTVALAAFSSMASMRACDSLLPSLADEFSVTLGTAAYTISVFAVAYGVAQIILGPAGDRFGKPRVIGWAAVVCALANIGVAMSGSLDQAVAWRVLAGGAAGGIVPLSLALIGDRVPYESRQVVLARLMTATLMGMIAGQWVGGMLADAMGWRTVFLGLAGLFSLAALPAFNTHRRERALPSPTQTASKGNFFNQLRQVLRNPWARCILAAVGLEGAFVYAAMSFVPSYLHHAFGLSLGEAGAVMALFAVGGLLYAVGAPTLIRRLGEVGLVQASGWSLALAMGALTFAPSWHWGMLACLLGGLGLYFLHSVLQTHATQMLPDLRGTAVASFVIFLFVGQSIGVVAAAEVVDRVSPRWVFAASMLVLPAVALWFSRKLRRRAQAAASANRERTS